MPPKQGAKTTPGEFQAIVNCNDCKDTGWALTKPAFLQTWLDDGNTLKLTKNVSIGFTQTPAAFLAPGNVFAGMNATFGLQPDGMVRTKDGDLLMALYGYAKDAPVPGKYTVAFYSSFDEGVTWAYSSRVDVTQAMTTPGEGPCEPSMVTLADGRVLAAFRLSGGIPLWQSYSFDNGQSWTPPKAMIGKAASGGAGMIPYGVWPELLLLSNGALVLGSGRPGIVS